MARDIHKEIAKAFLEETGYEVRLISEAQDGRRADILAVSASDSLIVEVKSRSDESTFAEAVQATPLGGHAEFHHTIRRNETLSKAILNASQQIESTRHLCQDALGIVWLRPSQAFGLFDTLESVLATLLGIRFAHVTDTSGRRGFLKCYYCDFSDFYRYRNIAAVVFNKGHDGLLIPNKWFSSPERLQASLLFKDYAKHEAVFDPYAEFKTGDALVLEREVNLRDQKAVQQALLEQYKGYRIILTEMWELGGLMPFERIAGTDSAMD